MGRSDIVQWKLRRDRVTNAASLDPACKVVDTAPARLWRKLIDNEEAHGRPAHNHRSELECHLWGIRAVDDAQAFRRHEIWEKRGIAGSVDLDDPLYTAPARRLSHAVDHGFRPVVDHHVSSGGASVFRLFRRAYRGDDPGGS